MLPLIYIMKRSKSPRIKPCRTPALMKPNDELWSFNKTCCFLLSRELDDNYNKLLQIPLRLSPSCHTLSRALDVSIKMSLTSNLLSKPLRISRVIPISWLMQESHGLKRVG